jgi:uncharacterized membrane protein (DUF4010 family)
MGGIIVVLGGNLLLAVTTAVVPVFCAVAYLRTHEQDPGLTSEAALVLAVLLGGLAQTQTATASGIAVVVTVLLAARFRLHHFVSDVISEAELTDALIFAAATLVVLPLEPDRYLGPFAAHLPAHDMEDCDAAHHISGGARIFCHGIPYRSSPPPASQRSDAFICS